METAFHYFNVAVWYIGQASALGWAVFMFFVGMHVGSRRWIGRVEELNGVIRHTATQLVELEDELARLNRARIEARVYARGRDPVHVHSEPSGEAPAAPERHDTPREGNEGV